MKKLIINLICLIYIFVIITIIIQDPLEKKPILQKEEPELSCIGVVSKDTVLVYVYFEPTPDSLDVEKCLEHAIINSTILEIATKTPFENTFKSVQDSLFNKQFNVRIDHFEIYKSYLYESLKQNIMKLDLNAMEQARLDMAQEGIIMTPLTQEDKQLLQSILN